MRFLNNNVKYDNNDKLNILEKKYDKLETSWKIYHRQTKRLTDENFQPLRTQM